MKYPSQGPKAIPAVTIARAIHLHVEGKLAEAEVAYLSTIAKQPGNFEALYRVGGLKYQQGDYPAAFEYMSKALTTKPIHVGALTDLGTILAALRKPEEAMASFDKALAIEPGHAAALNGRSNALLNLGRADDALASFDRLLAAKPDHVEALNNRGVVLMALGRPAEALISYDAALALEPRLPEVVNNRGNALRRLGRIEDALESFDRAIALRPTYAEAHDNRGVVLTMLGRLDEASAAFEQAIRLAPTRVRPFYNLTLTRRFEPGDPHIQAMENLAQDVSRLAVADQIELQFALSKAFADAGDHRRSFQHLLAGNGLKRAHTAYDEAATLEVFARAQTGFTNEVMRRQRGLGEPSAVPVFIIGMPRSGTTLVEQILASHPAVFGAGEIAAFGDAVEACAAAAGGAVYEEDQLWRLSAGQLRDLGANYLKRIQALAPAAERITNKTPGNFLLAGLIHLSLPNALIIHVRRDPLDTCMSCFSKLFTENLAYAYDLSELGRYFRAYEALMAHWRSVLPEEAMLEVRYEEIVADLDGQARSLVAYCDLEWDPRCLDFHLTKRPVHTASAAQVRQPIYRSSVGRWRVNEPFLRPLLAELGVPRSDAA